MAQGDFTKEEAQSIVEAVGELFDAIPKSKAGYYVGHLNDIYLFLAAAKRHAPNDVPATSDQALAKRQLENLVVGITALSDMQEFSVRTLDDGSVLITTYSWGEQIDSYNGKDLLEALDKALQGEGLGPLASIKDHLSDSGIASQPPGKSILLPCPFCGASDQSIRPDYSEDEPTVVIAYHVQCEVCGAKGRNHYPIGWCESEAAAIEAWNHRGSVHPMERAR